MKEVKIFSFWYFLFFKRLTSERKAKNIVKFDKFTAVIDISSHERRIEKETERKLKDWISTKQNDEEKKTNFNLFFILDQWWFTSAWNNRNTSETFDHSSLGIFLIVDTRATSAYLTFFFRILRAIVKKKRTREKNTTFLSSIDQFIYSAHEYSFLDFENFERSSIFLMQPIANFFSNAQQQISKSIESNSHTLQKLSCFSIVVHFSRYDSLSAERTWII